MAKKISNALFWIIAIIAILSFLGVVYLIVKDMGISGQAFKKISSDEFPSPLSACNWADDRNCEDGLTSGQIGGAECRRAGYTGGSRCTIVGKCGCYSHSV